MKAGFARIDITPPLGSVLIGYYSPRYAEDIITPLEANAVAISDGERTAVMVSLDLLGVRQDTWDTVRADISRRHGLPYDAIFLSCTHTHLGPAVSRGFLFPPDEDYTSLLFSKINDAVTLAIDDMRDATPYAASGCAEGLNFIRRFKMTDGTTLTNPSSRTDPKTVVGPIGEPDKTVGLVKFVRENAPDIALVNFQVHPDVIGGNKICADYPGFLRRQLEAALSDEAGGLGVRAIYFNGAQGDLIHADRFNTEKHEFNKILKSGVTHSRHIGRALAGVVLGMYTYAEQVRSDKVFFKQASAVCPSSRGSAEQVAIAKRVAEAYTKDNGGAKAIKELGLGMDYPEAVKLIRLEFGPDEFELYVSCVGFGDVAFIGFPGEPFAEIGRQTRAASPFKMTFVCHCANGYEGYFPMAEAFDVGGYEAPSSKFCRGVGETLIDTASDLLRELKSTHGS